MFFKANDFPSKHSSAVRGLNKGTMVTSGTPTRGP